MSPVVVVTRDATRDPLLIEWFEDEAGYYAKDPLAWVEFDPWRDTFAAKAKPNAQTETRVVTALTALALVLDASADVRGLATHYVPEPDASLEPIPGRGSAA